MSQCQCMVTHCEIEKQENLTLSLSTDKTRLRCAIFNDTRTIQQYDV